MTMNGTTRNQRGFFLVYTLFAFFLVMSLTQTMADRAVDELRLTRRAVEEDHRFIQGLGKTGEANDSHTRRRAGSTTEPTSRNE